MSNLIANRIKELRKANGFKSAESLAEALDVSLKTVQGWENDNKESNITLQNLLKMCDVFKCDLDYLVGRISERTHDIKTACEITGLSADTIETIQEFDEMGKQSLSWLIVFGSKAEIGFFEAWNEYMYSLTDANYATFRNNETKRDETGIDVITEDGRIILDLKATSEYRSIIVERRFSRLCADSFDRWNFFDLKTNKKTKGG